MRHHSIPHKTQTGRHGHPANTTWQDHHTSKQQSPPAYQTIAVAAKKSLDAASVPQCLAQQIAGTPRPSGSRSSLLAARGAACCVLLLAIACDASRRKSKKPLSSQDRWVEPTLENPPPLQSRSNPALRNQDPLSPPVPGAGCACAVSSVQCPVSSQRLCHAPLRP